MSESWKEMCKMALRQRDEAVVERDRLREALTDIVSWSKAYPLKIFPEPDMTKARKLLEAGGMTLDAISASNMRHVLKHVAEIATTALETR